MKNGHLELLNAGNCAVLLVDHQSPLLFGVQSHDRSLIVNNAVALAKAATVFELPIVLTTVSTEALDGPAYPELTDVLPRNKPIERKAINPWDDATVVNSLKRSGRRKLVVAGLWTSVSVAQAVLSALREGLEVYIVADASGDVSRDAHNFALHRMIQAGATPVTWQQVMHELQRDWAGPAAERVHEIVRSHFGAFGEFLSYTANLGALANGARSQRQKPAMETKRVAAH